MKRILITGGLGFIGSHLLEELVKNKEYEITVIDDYSTGSIKNLPFPLDKINLRIGRIQDFNLLREYDIIYHLAAKANTREVGLGDFIDNIMATEAVVKLLKPNGHIYFSSSCAVYGNQAIVTEESPFQPISPYGYSKWMGELIIQKQCNNYTIFRFSNVFGERQDGSNEMGLIGVIAYHKKNHTTMTVFNGGKNERDYVYVKDVVKAILTIHKKEVFQVGSYNLYKTLDLIKLSRVHYKIGKNNNEVETIKLDNAKLNEMGWYSTLTVTDYIKERIQ